MSLISYPPDSYYVTVKQQPHQALVLAKCKEKERKAIDPPPLVQLDVKQHQDPQKNFLQNPYLFMQASLYRSDRDEPLPGCESLAGTLTSSLHRLKDQNKDDVGLFVFGDISVRVLGTFRLHFSMWEYSPMDCQATFLASCTSKKFSVLAFRDFKGIDESTALSRCITEQGVRLRLRKEARTAAGIKRSYPYNKPAGIVNAHASLFDECSSFYERDDSPIKRERTYNSDGQTEPLSHFAMEQPYCAQPPQQRQFPSYPPFGQSPPITTFRTMMRPGDLVHDHYSSVTSPPGGVLHSNTGTRNSLYNASWYGKSCSRSDFPGSACHLCKEVLPDLPERHEALSKDVTINDKRCSSPSHL